MAHVKVFELGASCPECDEDPIEQRQCDPLAERLRGRGQFSRNSFGLTVGLKGTDNNTGKWLRECLYSKIDQFRISTSTEFF